MKKLVIYAAFVLLFLVSGSLNAQEEDVLVPAESEDIEAFDNAIDDTDSQFSEKRKNNNEAKDSELNHQYRERRALGETRKNGELEEGKEKASKKKYNKKGEKSEDAKELSEAVSKEMKKMKQEGDLTRTRTKIRVQDQLKNQEAIKEQTQTQSKGSSNASNVIPDPGKSYQGENSGSGKQEGGNTGGGKQGK